MTSSAESLKSQTLESDQQPRKNLFRNIYTYIWPGALSSREKRVGMAKKKAAKPA